MSSAERPLVVLEQPQYGGVLVAEEELDRPVLRRLEARRRAQRAAELGVLGRGERGQHRPLLDQRLLDVLDAGELLQRGREHVGGEVVARGAQLVQEELQPQLGGLVLDDEQQLVVVDGGAARLLGREQLVEVQVGGVGQVGPEIPDDPLLDRPGVRPGEVSGHVRQASPAFVFRSLMRRPWSTFAGALTVVGRSTRRSAHECRGGPDGLRLRGRQPRAGGPARRQGREPRRDDAPRAPGAARLHDHHRRLQALPRPRRGAAVAAHPGDDGAAPPGGPARPPPRRRRRTRCWSRCARAPSSRCPG